MNQNRNRRLMLSLYAMTGMIVLTGFTSLAAEPGSGKTAEEHTAELSVQEQEWAFMESAEDLYKNVEEEIKTVAESAHAAYLKKLEEERKAEEARRREEEKAAEAARSEARSASAKNAGVSAAEQELLAALIFCEAGNQPYEGQVAVGAVVMNRVKSGVYPNTVSEVIYQSGQFTPAMTGWLDSVLAGGGYTDSARQAAADALAGSNPVGECLYFSTGGYGLQIGDHYFH